MSSSSYGFSPNLQIRPCLNCWISKPAILPSYWKLLSSTSYPGSLFLRFCAFLFLVSLSHLHGQYPPVVSSSFSQPAFANYQVPCTVPGIEAMVETHLHGIVFWRAPGWTRTILAQTFVAGMILAHKPYWAVRLEGSSATPFQCPTFTSAGNSILFSGNGSCLSNLMWSWSSDLSQGDAHNKNWAWGFRCLVHRHSWDHWAEMI